MIQINLSTQKLPDKNIGNIFNSGEREAAVFPDIFLDKYSVNVRYGYTVFMLYCYFSSIFPDSVLPSLAIREENDIPYLYLTSIETDTDYLLMWHLMKNV